jgi:hypothetical protein
MSRSSKKSAASPKTSCSYQMRTAAQDRAVRCNKRSGSVREPQKLCTKTNNVKDSGNYATCFTDLFHVGASKLHAASMLWLVPFDQAHLACHRSQCHNTQRVQGEVQCRQSQKRLFILLSGSLDHVSNFVFQFAESISKRVNSCKQLRFATVQFTVVRALPLGRLSTQRFPPRKR